MAKKLVGKHILKFFIVLGVAILALVGDRNCLCGFGLPGFGVDYNQGKR